MFRDINKDPFIMYPVEGNVSTIPQKVSLLIQVELGRVDLTNVSGFERQRLRGEAMRVLEVMHRLIRAVVECKGSDSDGVGCWAALELARSLTAKAWEGRPMQLLQVPQVGPVLMRKLVAHNIRTVHQLVDADPGNIERIASRNPPFGKKMKDSVALFPRLTLAAVIKDSKVERDGKPVVYIDALLGFSNTRGKWMSKIPIVTFLAVTSEGVSAHFSRESLNSFKQEAHNSHQVRFTWEPSTPTETLICRFACEEIVGTVVSTELRHDIPALAFRHLLKKVQPLSTTRAASGRAAKASPPSKDEIDNADTEGLLNDLPRIVSKKHDEIESGVDDDDLFALIDRDGNFEQKPPKHAFTPTRNLTGIDDEIISDIDDDDLFAILDRNEDFQEKPTKSNQVLRKSKGDQAGGQSYDTKPPRSRKAQEKKHDIQSGEGSTAEEHAIRLPNGRYKCGHSCSQMNGGTTARGARCGHDCCRNGSKHPPKKVSNNGKRKEQPTGPDMSECESAPDFSLSEPPRKRARAADTSKTKANSSSSSSSVALHTEWRISPVRPKMDLSLYDIDEDGLVDLTQAYDSDEPVANPGRRPEAAGKLEAGRGGKMQEIASKTGSRIEDLLADVSDTDLMDFDDVMKIKGGSQGGLAPQKCSKNLATADSDTLASSSMRDDSRGKTDRDDFGKQAGSIQTAKKLQRKSRPLLSSAAPAAPRQPHQIGMDDFKEVPEWVILEDSSLQETGRKEEAEPKWVKDFDEDFISEFRGLVDFI